MENIFPHAFSLFRNYCASPQAYQVVERQNKLVYFSAFNLDYSELESIYTLTKTVRKNIYRKLLDASKYTVRQFVTIASCNSDKEKVLMLFSICFLHYYTLFSYDKCPSFKLFFSQDLIDFCVSRGVVIDNMNQFKVYCYAFYHSICSELEQTDYNKVKALYMKTQNTNSFLNNVVNTSYIQPLVSTKERIVDLVYYVFNTPIPTHNHSMNGVGVHSMNGMVGGFNGLNMDFQGNLNDVYTNDVNNNNSSNNNTNTNSNNSNISTSSSNINNHQSNNANGNNNDNTVANGLNNLNAAQHNKQPVHHAFTMITYNQPQPVGSARVFWDVTRNNLDNQSGEMLLQVANKLDMNYFNEKLSTQTINDIQVMNPFLCFEVELPTSELLVKFPGIPQDYYLRFFFLAKSIYLQALEIYFSIYDLAKSDNKTLSALLQSKLNIPSDNENIFTCFTYFFQIIVDELKKDNNQSQNHEFLVRIHERISNDWKEYIVKKAQEIIYFRVV